MPKFQMQAREVIKKEPERWNFAPENDTKIIAFSGKLGAGKSSCANFLHSLAFMFVLNLTEQAYIGENGKLIVKTDEGEFNEVNLDSKHPEVVDYLQANVWPFIKKYSCADPLKRVAIDILGLDEQLCYGSQTDKNTVTNLKWEDMPTKVEHEIVEDLDGEVIVPKRNNKKTAKRTVLRTGYMTIRDVLEYVGTELFRKMDNDCFAKAIVRVIQRERPAFAVIDDVRFPNEVNSIQSAGGKVIRLTLLTPEAVSNQHDSNTALDNYEGFDGIIDNMNLTMDDTFKELITKLTEWEYFKVVSQ